MSGRNCEVGGLFVKQEDVVVRVLRRLSRRCRAKVRSWSVGLGSEYRRSVLRGTAGCEILEKRVENGATGVAWRVDV